MLSETLLEGSFCQSNIVFPCFVVTGGYLCIVYNVRCEAAVIERAVVLYPLATCLCLFVYRMVDDGYRIFLLCLLMITCIFSIQL